MDLPIALGTVPADQAATVSTEGSQGHFSPGDPTQNQYPTEITAYWCESITMEMLNVQAGCGIVADGTKLNQVWTGLSGYFAPILTPVFQVSATAPVLNSTTLNVAGSASLGSLSVYGPVVGTGSGQFAGALSAASVNVTGPVSAGGLQINGGANVTGAFTSASISCAGAASFGSLALYGSLNSASGAVFAGGLTAGGMTTGGSVNAGVLSVYLGATFGADVVINRGANGSGGLSVQDDATIGGGVQATGEVQSVNGNLTAVSGAVRQGGKWTSGGSEIYTPINNRTPGVLLADTVLSWASNQPAGYFGTDVENGAILVFYSTGGAQIGSLSNSSDTGVVLVQTSDHRLKDEIQPLNAGDAQARIEALRPVDFIWKSNGKPQRGFIAHEFGAVYPAALFGRQDDVDENGEIIPQMIDQSAAIPDMVAELQALCARCRALEDEIAALREKIA